LEAALRALAASYPPIGGWLLSGAAQ